MKKIGVLLFNWFFKKSHLKHGKRCGVGLEGWESLK